MKEMNNRAFGGRVIFDHQPKTAGEALRVWLTKELGIECVCPHVNGPSQESIRKYGEEYSIIPGHFSFNGEGLDPRYQYITSFRDPVDRAVSWIFFVLKNHEKNQLTDGPEVFEAVETFVESEGEELDAKFKGYISNLYVRHFCSIETKAPGELSDAQKIEAAFSVIKKYDVVGLFEDMPAFLAEVANLIGIPAPTNIERVNVTKNRPSVDRISPALRQRIIELNQLDIELYKKVVERKRSLPVENHAGMKKSTWIPNESKVLIADIDFKKQACPEVVESVKGLSGNEPGGHWTDASLHASAVLKFTKPLPKSFILELMAEAFGPNAGAEVAVRVGKIKQHFVVEEPGKVQCFELLFDGTSAADTVEIIPPAPTAPCDLDPASKDTRKLGVRLVSLKIIEK